MSKIGFDNGELVPVEETAPFEYPESTLPPELEEIVRQRVEAEKAAVAAMAVNRLIVEILDHEDKELTAIAIGCAVGLSLLDGRSMAELARERGITRAALSKRVVEVTKTLGLPPARGMKSIEARDAYRKRQLKIHEKNKRPQQKPSFDFFERFSKAYKRTREGDN